MGIDVSQLSKQVIVIRNWLISLAEVLSSTMKRLEQRVILMLRSTALPNCPGDTRRYFKGVNYVSAPMRGVMRGVAKLGGKMDVAAGLSRQKKLLQRLSLMQTLLPRLA